MNFTLDFTVDLIFLAIAYLMCFINVLVDFKYELLLDDLNVSAFMFFVFHLLFREIDYVVFVSVLACEIMLALCLMFLCKKKILGYGDMKFALLCALIATDFSQNGVEIFFVYNACWLVIFAVTCLFLRIYKVSRFPAGFVFFVPAAFMPAIFA